MLNNKFKKDENGADFIFPYKNVHKAVTMKIITFFNKNVKMAEKYIFSSF